MCCIRALPGREKVMAEDREDVVKMKTDEESRAERLKKRREAEIAAFGRELTPAERAERRDKAARRKAAEEAAFGRELTPEERRRRAAERKKAGRAADPASGGAGAADGYGAAAAAKSGPEKAAGKMAVGTEAAAEGVLADEAVSEKNDSEYIEATSEAAGELEDRHSGNGMADEEDPAAADTAEPGEERHSKGRKSIWSGGARELGKKTAARDAGRKTPRKASAEDDGAGENGADSGDGEDDEEASGGLFSFLDRMNERSRRRLEIIMTIAVPVLFIYCLGAAFFQYHFLPGTVLNGVGVGMKNVPAAEEILAPSLDTYSLTLKGVDGIDQIAEGVMLGVHFTDMDWVKEAVRSQTQSLWLFKLFGKKKVSVDEHVGYDAEAFEKTMAKCTCLNPDYMIAPEDAHLTMTEDGFYVITPEVVGTTIDAEAAKAAAADALSRGVREVSLSEFHVKPEIYSDDPILTSYYEQYQKFAGAIGLTYVFWDGSKEVFDGPKLDSVLTIENDQVILDHAKISTMMAQWREKHDSIGRSFDFMTHSGQLTNIVPGGDYGYELNEEGTAEDIVEHIENNESGEYEPKYWNRGMSSENHGLGNTYVEVSLAEQMMWVWVDGQVVVETPVTTGMPTPENDRITHQGCFDIDWKAQDQILGDIETRGYSSHVDYWVGFNQYEGIHDAAWRDEPYEFGGVVYQTYGSHGCVNTPASIMPLVYDNVVEGEAVVVY